VSMYPSVEQVNKWTTKPNSKGCLRQSRRLGLLDLDHYGFVVAFCLLFL
jgi:hypothetical protein